MTPGGKQSAAAQRRRDAEEILELLEHCIQREAGDWGAWEEESARQDAERIAWPQQSTGKGYPQLLRCLFGITVGHIREAMGEALGPECVPEEDPRSGDFQLVLRIAKRVVVATDAELVARFGGTGRMSIKRDLINLFRERAAAEAVASGHRRAAAFRASGISQAALYRAIARARQRS